MRLYITKDDILAVARPGDTVFIRLNRELTARGHSLLVEQAKALRAETDVEIVFLSPNAKIESQDD